MSIEDWFSGLATLVTGAVAISLYFMEKRRKKKQAAKIILQEIRRAESIIDQYKKFNNYKLNEKIIVNNSWANNIHYFVKHLSPDALDKISNLYSTGTYLDSIIQKISDFKFDQSVGGKNQPDIVQVPIPSIAPQNIQGGKATGPSSIPGQPMYPQQDKSNPISFSISLQAPWEQILNEVSSTYEPIYHTEICQKLKRIARNRLFKDSTL